MSDAEQQAPRKNKGAVTVAIVIGIILVVVGIIGIIVISSVQYGTYVESSIPNGYGLVWDAGSSSSKLYVYQWPVEKEDTTAIVEEINYCKATGGGISSYADDPDGAGQSLETCMNETALETVPEDEYVDSPIILGSTAGMRLAEKEDKDASDAILDAVNTKLQSYPFDVTSASILTGGQEGSFSWITVNYLLSNFAKGPKDSLWSSPSDPPKKTVGAIDMGGASVQMTFIPEDPSSVPAENSLTLRLYGQNYTVYSHSFLCYGSNEALRRYLATLVKEANYTSPVVDPCAPSGYSEDIGADYLFDAYCSQGEEALKAWGSEVKLPYDLSSNSTFTLEGSSDPQQCQTEILKLFNTSTYLNVYKAQVYGEFYAFSTFYFAVKLQNLSSNVGLTDYITAVDEFCAKPWSEVETYPTDLKELLPVECFKAKFVFSFLADPMSFNFTEDTWNITFVKDIYGTRIGWSLGFMLNATNLIPSEDIEGGWLLSPSVYIGLIILFVIILIAGVIITIVACRSKGSVYTAVRK